MKTVKQEPEKPSAIHISSYDANARLIENKRPKREVKSRPAFLENFDEKPVKRKSKRFHCKKCRKNKSFSTIKQLERHVQSHHENKDAIICEICSAKLKSEVYYKRHVATRHPDTPKSYVCDFDGKAFAAKDYLRIHMDRHRVHQILTCKTCYKSYISKHTFRRHLKMHIEKHVCNVCGLIFSAKSLFENHYASKHSKELPFPCGYCTRLFPSKTARNNHHYIAHKNNKDQLNFKCEECNVFFEMKEDLRIHSFIHFNGEIKTCLECNQIFKTTRLLKIHMQKHEVKKSFQCSSCREYFTFKTGLAKHIRLNRCRGPDSAKRNDDNDSEVAEMAMQQLSEITKRKPNPQVVNVMLDIKEESLESECTNDFEEFFNEPRIIDEKPLIIKQEPLIKEEPFETEREDIETLKTRKMRKRKIIEEPKRPRSGRAHLTYTCDYCGETIKYFKEILNHMKQHIMHQRYSCIDCSEKFKSRKKLIDHSLTVHGTKPQVVKGSFICEFCDRKFDARSIYEAHKLSHDNNARSHVCLTCSAAFKSIGNLRRHEAIHAETRDFHCSNCPKSFKTRLALKIHNEAVHADMKIFVNCSICKVIIQEKHLRTHMKNQHTDEGQEKPFSCTICFKTFKTEKLGQRHYESVHEPKEKDKIYVCGECPGLEFYRHRDLKEHSFLHFDGIIYQCETCLKMFKSKRLLMIHSTVHSESPGIFPCDICEIAFRTRGGRRKHRLRVHGSKV